MKSCLQWSCLIMVFVFVSGCGPSGSDGAEDSGERETVFDPMVQTLERAESVEAQSQDRKKQLERNLEESEQ